MHLLRSRHSVCSNVRSKLILLYYDVDWISFNWKLFHTIFYTKWRWKSSCQTTINPCLMKSCREKLSHFIFALEKVPCRLIARNSYLKISQRFPNRLSHISLEIRLLSFQSLYFGCRALPHRVLLNSKFGFCIPSAACRGRIISYWSYRLCWSLQLFLSGVPNSTLDGKPSVSSNQWDFYIEIFYTEFSFDFFRVKVV